MECLPFFTTPVWVGSLGLDLKKITKSCREFSSKVETLKVSNVGGYQGHDFNNQDFIKFKKECSKTGTTEESIAAAEKLGFKTDLLAINPFDETKNGIIASVLN